MHRYFFKAYEFAGGRRRNVKRYRCLNVSETNHRSRTKTLLPLSRQILKRKKLQTQRQKRWTIRITPSQAAQM